MRMFVMFAAIVLPAIAFAAEAPDWAFPDQNANPQPPADAAPPPAANAAVRMLPDAAAPAIVREGKGPMVRACDGCHFVTGLGEPESAGLAGLPSAYFVETMADFRSGARKGARAANMIAFAKGLTDDENKTIGDYYASLKDKPWVKVVESATVPKTYIGPQNARHVWPAGGDEAIGERVIEFAPDFATLRAADSQGYVAYVPPGSIAAGETLVKTGGGKATACIGCHGATLTGAGNVPGIAGRSPVYTARQIYMFQSGDRAGPNGEIMKAAVSKLQDNDIVAIAAYLASRPPA